MNIIHRQKICDGCFINRQMMSRKNNILLFSFYSHKTHKNDYIYLQQKLFVTWNLKLGTVG